MEWIETTGKSVPEAVDSAIDKLGINLDELEYEIISEPKKGVFGLGSNQARIRARVKPVSREKPRDKNVVDLNGEHEQKQLDKRARKAHRQRQDLQRKKRRWTRKLKQ